MFTGLMAILQALWPFLKESVFGNDTFKEWVANNKLICSWLVLLIVMFCLVLYLSEMVTNIRHQEEVASHGLELVKVQYTELKTRYDTLDHDKQELAVKNTKLGESNYLLDSKVRTYEHWMALCGMDFSYTGNGPDWPRCTAPVVKSGKTRTPRAPVHHNEQIIDRLRRWGDKE